MKLIRVEFENFRLLRNLTLEFSTDDLRKLTVIRAENETGKTTILSGVQWALYGDNALPDRGRDFRLHPIDWDTASDGKEVAISVEVDLETVSIRRSPKGISERKNRFRIIRSAFETIDGTKWERSPSTARLYHLSDRGSEQIDQPETYLLEMLPPELREVFFTDGDRALSFIDTTISRSTKRGRVQKAIRSLLDLGVIEDALKHVKNATSEVNKTAKRMEMDQNLTEVATRLEELEKSIADCEVKTEDAKLQYAAFDEKFADIRKEIEAALVKGDREQLKNEIEQTEQNIKKIDRQLEAHIKEHAGLFRSEALARDVLAPVLVKGLDTLSKLHDKGEIPKSTIPVLEEHLSGTRCICGESLDASEPDGNKRREHIQQLIEQNRRADELQSTITDLYFGSRSLQPEDVSENERWVANFDKIAAQRDDLESTREAQGKKRKALDAKLDEIPREIGIQGLRETMQQYSEQRDRHFKNQVLNEDRLVSLRSEQERLTARRDNLLREQRKGARILAELEVTQDIERVLRNSYERLTNEELQKVSELMNSIFLEMIGVDTEQNAIIRKADIDQNFDIVVHGPNDRELNPDRDLNGASRRALTLAFILALTKVSEVKAANVIDTPLGMMSGYVKKSVLKTAIRESSQLILFLTRSEIKDCEEILDTNAGKVITLTNPLHYPLMLVNDPKVNLRTILRCDCNHRKECPICQRHLDPEPEKQKSDQGNYGT